MENHVGLGDLDGGASAEYVGERRGSGVGGKIIRALEFVGAIRQGGEGDGEVLAVDADAGDEWGAADEMFVHREVLRIGSFCLGSDCELLKSAA